MQPTTSTPHPQQQQLTYPVPTLSVSRRPLNMPPSSGTLFTTMKLRDSSHAAPFVNYVKRRMRVCQTKRTWTRQRWSKSWVASCGAGALTLPLAHSTKRARHRLHMHRPCPSSLAVSSRERHRRRPMCAVHKHNAALVGTQTRTHMPHPRARHQAANGLTLVPADHRASRADL